MLKFHGSVHKLFIYYNTLRSVCTAEIRPSFRNHYELLNLNKDCTSKEVRDAFISLSKQLHPDKNRSDPKNHQKFVKINEAYSVLSRPETRSAYDLTLRNEQTKKAKASYSSRQAVQYHTVYTDLNEYYNLRKPEYSHTGGNGKFHTRLSKSWIVLFCILFAASGVGLQILAIRNSITFSRDKLDEMTEKNSKILADVHSQAIKNGLEKQLELMKQKIEGSFDQHNENKRKNG